MCGYNIVNFIFIFLKVFGYILRHILSRPGEWIFSVKNSFLCCQRLEMKTGSFRHPVTIDPESMIN